jgi:hypothetical protein
MNASPISFPDSRAAPTSVCASRAVSAIGFSHS